MKPISRVVPLISLLPGLHLHPTMPSSTACTQFQETVRVSEVGVTGLTLTFMLPSGRPRLRSGRGGIVFEVGGCIVSAYKVVDEVAYETTTSGGPRWAVCGVCEAADGVEGLDKS